MRTANKAEAQAQREAEAAAEAARAAEVANAPATTTNALTPPPGEDIDGGDVDEVIHLDPQESITVLYKGYKETKGKKPGEINRLHKIVMADGVSRGMWGTVQLNSMLDKCSAGDELWIAYLGKEEIPGGKTLHNWKVVRTKKAAR